ncbi:2,3-dimethylmalate lyase [Serratia entomophila]|uniref:isocitrate lyase/PEP mutase family protein n=1 Tax=Serratia entomophila TaxID=42906 RepID=UPI002178DA57|nr:oxaloacetate decarboxylase [Serratia entomophila]CAI1686238.1 2,3-dimethylmalate lyase [Serratia entomophila]CAI2924688.1 2,3-dimethylmalate lyase [Serratia entomophila]
MSKAQQLRTLIEARRALPMPGVYDAFSARLAERAGFQALQVSGFAVAAATLGLPDIGILSLRDQINAVQVIAQAVDIPVMADGDTGFGNALNAYHTVRLLELAGAAGVNLEDQSFPKRCGHMDGKSVIPVEEMVQKIRAAAAARVDPDFVINARTDAIATEGLSATIARANAYAAAGATVIFIEAIRSQEEIAAAVAQVQAPISINMVGTRGGKSPLLSLQELERLGVARVSYPILTLCAAGSAMQQALTTLAESGRLDGLEQQLLSFDEVTSAVGLPAERAREQAFAL